jgi:hypothetical protein
MKFRKKPIVIEAVQFKGDAASVAEISQLCGAEGCFSNRDFDFLQIVTLEGTMRADINDWIIKGVKGEVYPCKPDIFAATYEPVE